MAALDIAEPFHLPGAIVFGDLAGAKLFIGHPFDGGADDAAA